ncbi:DNRLRE domain-containing protein [Paenibacillus hodogayensis]|uniref:DNRLRE domain-containing protein n=1 Tax=Paenibacillus hodogayensis TaxID=279208 RepID=A0ABV5VYD9_9BACL
MIRKRKSWISAVHLLTAALLLAVPLGPGRASANGSAPAQLLPTDDAFVRYGSFSTQNYGSSTQLVVKNNEPELTRQSFLKFDLGSYSGDIASAKLRIFGHLVGTGAEALWIYGLEDNSWNESAVTWATKPAAVHVLADIQVDSAWRWHEIDITSFVKARAAADGKAGIALIQPGAKGTTLEFNSKENAINKPVLVLSGTRSVPASPFWPAGADITVSEPDESTMRLSWPSAQPNQDVAKYRIYRDGTAIADIDASAGPTYVATSLQPGKTYTFRVEVAGSNGQWSTDGPFRTFGFVGTALRQTKLGNIFVAGEPISFGVTTPKSSVSWAVYDYRGNAVSQGSEPISGGQATITVPYTGYGYFTLKAQAEQPGKTPVPLLTPFAVLEPFDLSQVGDESPFGIVTHMTRSHEGWGTHLMDTLTLLGTKYIRDGLEWASVEKQKGVYSFSSNYDRLINVIHDAHINMLLVTGYNNPFYDNNATPYSDEGRQGFANYVKAYMERYPHIIRWVEVYNEFNIGFGNRGNGPAQSKPEYYYPLLKKVYETVKSVDPTVTVMGPTPSEVNLRWLEQVFQLGGLPYMDKFSIHPYRYPDSPEVTNQQLFALHNLIRQYNNGQTKPIWTTEAGWPTHVGDKGTPEDRQAEYLVRLIALSLANGVEKFWWYDLMDDGMDETYHEHRFGLIRNVNDPLGAYTPKPIYAAYGAMTRLLNGYTYADTDTVSSSVYSVKFSKGQQDRRVLWSSGETTVTIQTYEPLVVHDLMGNAQTYSPVQGRVVLTATESPQYVDGTVTAITYGSAYSAEVGSVFAGDPIEVTLRHDNTTQTEAVSTEFEIMGQTFTLNAPAGQAATRQVLLPALNEAGKKTLDIRVRVNGQLAGQLSALLNIRYPLTLGVQHKWADGIHTLGVTASNLSSRAVTVSGLQWKVGDQGQTIVPSSPIAGGGRYTADIPLSNPQGLAELPVNLTASVQQLPPLQYNGKVMMVDGNAARAIPFLSPAIDGDLTDWAGVAPIRLPQDGTIKITGYGGPEDLSGDVKIAWDSQNLYVSAQMTDDVFFQNEEGVNAWKGDSLQFGLVGGAPGEAIKFYELMISLTPSGKQTYRMSNPLGSPPTRIDNAQLQIVRDETKKTTIYELALPWSNIPDIRPDQGLYGLSVLVNDNDGGGRRGWLEWGSGIGSGKNPALFKLVRFVP